jgi:hypothetical protein
VARTAGGDPAKLEGMGCALSVMALTQDRAGHVGWLVASVGDVRVISRGPDGTVRLETRDHTPAFARWEAGEIPLDEVPDSPGANRLMRAVGHGGEADTTWLPARPGWSYLLHSDGVTKAMRLDELGEAMGAASAAAACEAITRKVEERGPDDNYTAVVVRVVPDDGSIALADATLPNPGAAPASPHRARDRGPESIVPGGTHNLVDDDVNRRSSPLGWLATVLAVLALALGAWAAWSAAQARTAAENTRADLAAYGHRVDSLAARLAPDTTRLPVSTDSAAARPPAAPAPAAAPAPRTPTSRP